MNKQPIRTSNCWSYCRALRQLTKVPSRWRLIEPRTKRKANTKARTKTKAKTGGTMELMALAMLLVVDGDAAREIVATKAKAKGNRRANQNQNAKLLARIAKYKTKIDSRQCQICVEYGHWSRGCPNRMVQQVVKTGQHGGGDQRHQTVHLHAGGRQVPVQPRQFPQSRYLSSTTASCVRKIFTHVKSLQMASPEAYDMKMMIDAKRWIVCRKVKNKARKPYGHHHFYDFHLANKPSPRVRPQKPCYPSCQKKLW